MNQRTSRHGICPNRSVLTLPEAGWRSPGGDRARQYIPISIGYHATRVLMRAPRQPHATLPGPDICN